MVNNYQLRTMNFCQLSSVLGPPSSVVYPLSSVNCPRPSTFVENPLQIHLFYAKQSQFTGDPNEHNLCYNNQLQRKPPFQPPQKQTQFKPNLLYAQNERNLCYTNRLQRKPAFQPPPKQTQFKPNQTFSHLCKSLS